MKEVSISSRNNIFQILGDAWRDFVELWWESDAEEKETELPEVLRIVSDKVDKDAEDLIDRKYTPKKSRELLKQNSLKKDLSVKDLKEATKSSPQIQSAEFVKKNNEGIEENTSSKEIAD